MSENHLVFTYNDTTMKLSGYLNGVLNKTITLSQSLNQVSSGNTLKISAGPKGGLIDNFMVFSKALSASDIGKLFNTATYSQAKLVACNRVRSPSRRYMYTRSGIYIDTIVGYLQCDSIVTLSVTINKSVQKSINPIVCSFYVSPSKKYTYIKSGIYLDTLLTIHGCDSVIKINLTVNDPTSLQVNKTVCGGYISPTGKYYSTSGTYTDTLINAVGCDSFIYTNLTVNQSSKSRDTISICEFYRSPMGKIYNVTGEYYDTIINSVGCDSFITTDLTILKPSSYDQNVSACDSYISASGTVYNQSGNYSDTILNTLGCDSIINTNLTINRSFFNNEALVVRTCHGYRSPKGTWIYQTGLYYDTLSTINGCDSIYALDVTIDTVNLGVRIDNNTMNANQLGAKFKWLDCNENYTFIMNETSGTFKPKLDGIYAVEINLNTCNDTTDCYEMKNLQSSAISVSNVTIYPNPGTGVFEIVNKNAKIQTLRILNSNGQELMVKTNVQSKSTSVNLAQWPDGIYVFEIVADGYLKKSKVVKLK